MTTLQIKNLKKKIGGRQVIDIKEGNFQSQKIYGIVGPNGPEKQLF